VLIAKKMFPHKSKTEELQVSFWLAVLAKFGAVIGFTTESGISFLKTILKF
jgi:hypothetical protein